MSTKHAARQTSNLRTTVVDLPPGAVLDVGSEDREHVVVVQRGRVSVLADGPAAGADEPVALGERDDVFGGRASAVRVPAGRQVTLTAVGDARVAVVSATATAGGDVTVVRPSDVTTETRGTGNWTREVHDVVPVGDGHGPYLVVGETFSRGGVWSSFPPHRHAYDDGDRETLHAEVFQVRIEPPSGFAVLLDYPDDASPEVARVLHDGDVVDDVTGFHSFAVAGGHELYYLWALWGQEPTPRFRTDERHAWIEKAG